MTAQASERIIFNGQTVLLHSYIPLPDHLPELIRLEDEELNVEGKYFFLFLSTACWRKYIGTWEIKDDRLYFVDVKGRYKWTGETPLLADWVSGTIQISQGECLKYVHMGFASIYERETYLTIEEGRVVSSRTLEHTPESVKDLDPFSEISPEEDSF